VIVEGSVAVLLAVTIGYCAILNQRLKRLHQDREMLRSMLGDLVQATALANAAVTELKAAAFEADTKLHNRLEEAERLGLELARHVASGGELMEKIARITAAARVPNPAEQAAAVMAGRSATAVEPQGRVQSALQQLSMRPNIGGKAA
jgi:hypothetical protein